MTTNGSPLKPPGAGGPWPNSRLLGQQPIVPRSEVPFREPPVKPDGLLNFPPAVPGLGPEPVPVHEPGGELVQKAVHPSIQWVDQLYRKAPHGAWFNPSVSNTNPVQFEIGSFTVPNAMSYWLFDYSFEMDRQSGLFAGASVPVDGESLTGIIGFDVTDTLRRPGNLLFELDPTAVTAIRTAFNPSTANPAVRGSVPASSFDTARYTSFALTSGQGTSLLPPKRGRQGPPSGPWAWHLAPGARLAFTAVIYQPMPVPLTAIGVRHQGYLVPSELSNAILQRVRPR